MSDLGWLSFPGLDQAAGTIMLPLWAAGVAVAALILFLFLAILRVGLRVVIGSITGIGLVVVAAVTAYTFSHRFDRAEERRALDQRMLVLTARAFAPGSALACLDAHFSETVEDSCEKTVFASPEMVAAAIAYMDARLSLLNDGVNFATHSDASYETTLAGLRRAIEADRFGFVAEVLATRRECTPAKCDALALLRDANRVRSNLNDRIFDELVARYASNWPQHARSEMPVAALRPPATGWKFPSASSIPPVTIMTNEPATPAQPAAAAPPATTAPVVAPLRRPATSPPPRVAQPRTPPTNPAGLPVQIGPPSTNDDTQSRTPQP
jgi:hypothetical protein